MATPEPTRSRSTLLAALAIIAIGTAAFILQLTGPSDLLNDDQLRPAAYTLDIVANNRWVVQTDFTGAIASKPPVYTWTSALLSLPTGRVTELTLYLPCALAITGAALLILKLGHSPFGVRAAAVAGAVFILSPYGFKHVALARTDAMFVFWVTVTAVLTWRAWRTGRGIDWTCVWLAAAVATLTKGPLGLLLGTSGILAAVWEWRDARRAGSTVGKSDHRLTPVVAGNLAGIVLFLLIAGGWFMLAWKEAGQPFIDRVIGRELVGHMVGSGKGQEPETSLAERLWAFASGLVKPSLYFITRFAPWSFFAILGIERAIRRPAADPHERRLERFCICWFVPGLILFSLVPHQRADLLLPLVPAAALLAGREIWRLAGGWSVPTRCGAIAGALVIAFGAAYYQHHLVARERSDVKRLAGVREVADQIRPLTRSMPLIDADAPAIQWFLGTKNPRVPIDEALSRLAGSDPVLVAVREDDRLADRLSQLPEAVRTVARWPADTGRPAAILILTNAPDHSGGAGGR